MIVTLSLPTLYHPRNVKRIAQLLIYRKCQFGPFGLDSHLPQPTHALLPKLLMTKQFPGVIKLAFSAPCVLLNPLVRLHGLWVPSPILIVQLLTNGCVTSHIYISSPGLLLPLQTCSFHMCSEWFHLVVAQAPEKHVLMWTHLLPTPPAPFWSLSVISIFIRGTTFQQSSRLETSLSLASACISHQILQFHVFLEFFSSLFLLPYFRLLTLVT